MIAGYRLGRKLGEGTFGAVYEAEAPDGALVALKISLRKLVDSTTKEAILLLNEIDAMRRLEHPSLVRVHDAGTTEDGRVFIAMELVAGEPLDRFLLRREKLDAIEAIRLVAAMADAVAICHDLEILHLDLKPHNVVLVDPLRPTLKVLDFGLAHVSSAWRAGREASGTPYYMSPERFEAASPDVRDDLYALGVILYELCTGTTPFIGDTLNAIYAAKCGGEFEAASSHNRGVTPAVDRIIASLLEPARQLRPSSARNLADELGEIAFETLAGFSATPSTRPLELATVPGQLPFVGRVRELTHLLASVRTHSKIAGSGIVVVGEAGVGKSRLVARFLDDLAESSTVEVGYGRCREFNTALPFSPWREAIGRLAEANPLLVNALAPELAAVAGLLARLIPELSARLGVGDDDDGDGTPVAMAIAMLLEFVGQRQPSAIVIEDAHWADAGSRAVLAHLANVGVPPGITIVVTTRAAEPELDPFGVLFVESLSGAEGDSLIGVGIGCHDTHLVAELKARVPLLATGNPLVTVQVLRHLESQRCLYRDHGRLRVDRDRLAIYQPPECIRGVVAASLSELAEQTRNVMAVGALLGRSFHCEDLYGLGLFERPVIRAAFSEALAAQVLTRSECGTAAIFVHDTIRDELTGRVGAAQKRRLHAQIAGVLAARGASAAEIAHHADLGGDPWTAAEHQLRAGREARAIYSPVDAAGHLERAASNALRAPRSADRDQLLSQATFELVAATAQLGNTEETLAHLDRCAGAIRDPSIEAQIALEAGYARVFYVRGEFNRAAHHSDACLRLTADHPEFSAYTLIPLALSGRGKTASGRFGPAADVLAKVVELAEAQGEWLELAHSLGVRGISLAYAGRFREAHDSVDRSLDIAHHTGDPVRMLAGLFYRSVIAEAAHDLELGLVASTHALRYASDRQIGGIYHYLSTLFAGRQQYHAGEIERAVLLLTQALDAGGRLDITMGRGWNYAFLGDALFVGGDVTAARSAYESAIHFGDNGAGDEYAGPAGLIGLAHVLSRSGASDGQIDALAGLALSRAANVGNVSLAATIHDRLASLWGERSQPDRASRADEMASRAFLNLRLNRRGWSPLGLSDTVTRRRRSPSRHPTLIGAASAPN